ncbi:MAG: hypothetical protein WCH57_01205 [Verrucomicrobiota bacterium]
MKRFLAAALALSLAASSAFALVGGPHDANIFGNANTVNPSNINGTYQGTIKGKNISGITVFGTSTAGTSGTAGTTTIILTGSGNSYNETMTTTPSTSQGYAVVYIEGKIATADLAAVVDLGARNLSGVIEGAGARSFPLTLINPSYVGATGTGASFSVHDSVYFTGNFSAKLSKSWASNSYSGKGTLMVTKVDINGFNQAVANPLTSATASPQIVTVPTSIKVAGVKTSNTAGSYVVNTSTATQPIVTGTNYPYLYP